MVFDNMNISIITYSVIMVIGTTQLYIFYIPYCDFRDSARR